MTRLLALPLSRHRQVEGRPSRLRHLGSETLLTLPVVLPVGLAGAAALAAAAVHVAGGRLTAGTLAGVAGLLAASVAAEAFPLPIEGVRGNTSLATVFIVATGVIYGWGFAGITGFLTMAAVELGKRRLLPRIVFNTGLYVLAGIASGLAAHLVDRDHVLSLVWAALLGAIGFYLVNIPLLAAVVSRQTGAAFLPGLRSYVYSTGAPFLIMSSLTATLVILWDRSPFVTIVLLAPLIAIALYQRWLHGALDRLREFDRMKDEFIAVVSHELRTPLTSVLGSALTLQQQDLDDETRATLLTIVSDEAGRLARLLDDVLWASRLDSGRADALIMPVDGAAVARDVVDASTLRLAHGLSLELACEPELPRVAADPDKLRQVMVNLVENAIKYSPDGGRVEVKLGRTNRHLRFTVRDEGLGIAPNEQARIFEKFHRLDPNMTRGVSGSGLGLYICRELVDRMGGRIWVASREGSGSTFTFELPIAD
jgi:signal transduction histidine kinase